MARRPGTFFIHALITKFGFSHERYLSCTRQFGRLEVDQHNRLLLRLDRPKRLPKSTSLAALLPLLTFIHERQHYQDIISTPCGLFLWRAFYAIVSTGGFVLHKLRQHGAIELISIPLLDWFATGGEDQLLQRQLLGADFPIVIAKILELRTLLQTTKAFMDNQSWTMKEFLHFANHSSALFKRRFELDETDFEWCAHYTEASSYRSNPGFSLTHILEANARLAERLALRELGASSALVREWNEQFVSSTDQPVYEWLLNELRSPLVARIAIDIALMGPVDPCCTVSANGKVFVEDALPCWRLTKIVPLLREIVLPFDGSELAKICDVTIASEAGISSPRSAVSSLLSQPLSSSGCYTRDAALTHESDSIDIFNSYFVQLEENFKTGFDKRRQDPIAFSWLRVRDIVPLFEFFQDRVVFHFKQLAGAPPQIMILHFCHLVSDLTILAALGEFQISQIFDLEPILIRELDKRGAPKEDYPPPVKSMIAETLGSNIKFLSQ